MKPTKSLNLCVFLLLLLAPISQSGKSRGSNKSVKISHFPTRVEAFTTDVKVEVIGGARHAIVKLFYGNEREAIAGQLVTEASRRSQLIFDCGYFIRKGNYKFKYYDPTTSKNSLASSILRVEWPNLAMNFKTTGQLYSADNEVLLSFPQVQLCKSYLMKNYKTKVSIRQQSGEITSLEHPNFPTSQPLLFSCDSLTTPGGYYAAVYVIAYNSTLLVAKSETVQFQWSSRYDVIVYDDNWFCADTEEILLKIKKPPCAPTNDKIQMTVVHNQYSSDVIHTYDVNSASELSFPCLDSTETETAGICFSYMTSQDTVLRKRCFDTSKNSEFNMDGSWSTWSTWNVCTRSCNNTILRRHRNCDNPQPLGDGQACEESAGVGRFEIEESASTCGQIKEWESSDCLCGCYVTSGNGEEGVVVSPIAGQCLNEAKIIWIIAVPPNSVIQFRVEHYDVSYGEYVTVGDRNHSKSVSLPSSTEVGYEMTSSDNEAEISYSRNEHDASCGFILKYVVKEVNRLRPMPMDFASTTTTIWENIRINSNDEVEEEFGTNSAVIVGVCICIFIILIALTVSCKRHRSQRRAKKERLKGERRTDFPPDGKSSSDMEEQSERRLVYPNVDSPRSAGTSLIPPQPGAYYLAQRQLQLMKKIGDEGAMQVYEASVLQIPNIRDQEDLLFGDTLRRDKSQSPDLGRPTTA